MGMKLSELPESSAVTLLINFNNKAIQLQAIVRKHLKDNIAFMTIEYETSKKLSFDNVQVDLEYYQEDNVPIIWHNVKIIGYHSGYLIKVFSEGTKHNRRDFFRVGVSISTRLLTSLCMPKQIIVKDLSLSGFSITDNKKELSLHINDEVSVAFDDLGHNISLTGKIVRIEDREDVTIYGLKVCNLCKDLSAYINLKQQKKRNLSRIKSKE